MSKEVCESCIELRTQLGAQRKEIWELRRRITGMSGMIFEINEIITDVKRYPYLTERYHAKQGTDAWTKERK